MHYGLCRQGAADRGKLDDGWLGLLDSLLYISTNLLRLRFTDVRARQSTIIRVIRAMTWRLRTGTTRSLVR